jgi:hypothetical protein
LEARPWLTLAACTDNPVAPLDKTLAGYDDLLAVVDFDSPPAFHDSLFHQWSFTHPYSVAFKAHVSGTWNEVGQCIELNGTGTATHLGRVEVTGQQLCVRGDEITGEFRIAGRRGTVHVAGHYHPEIALIEGTRPVFREGRLSAVVKITEASVTAVKLNPEDAIDGWLGWGWIQGMLESDGSFTYEIDGWVHHRDGDIPGLSNR